MNTRYWILLLILTTCTIACSEQDTPIFEGKSYIFFKNDYKADSTSVSFFFHPGETKIPIDLELQLGGEALSKDLPLQLGIVEELSTVKPGDYEFPKNPVFRANHETDTLRIWVIKSTKLDNQTLRLVVDIEDTDAYTAGPKSQRYAKILFTAQKSQPAWWDKNFTKIFLGTYSHAKYEEFMKVTKVSDLSVISRDEVYELCLKFKYYLIERAMSPEGPVMDGDKAMTVNVIG